MAIPLHSWAHSHFVCFVMSRLTSLMVYLIQGKASVVRKLDLKKEIEWRKRRRRMINEVKSNLLESDDVIDMLGVLEARAYSPEGTCI